MEHLENPGRWVSLHEKITDWEWFKGEMHHFKVFVYLLLKANYKDGSWRGVEIKRGQRITGLKSLSEDTGVSINRLRIILRDLKSTGEITIKSTNKYSIITVTNYEKYQNAQSADHRPDHNQITNKSQTDHKQITTNNKENKEYKENKSICTFFDRVHDLYKEKFPRKKGAVSKPIEKICKDIRNENDFIQFANAVNIFCEENKFTDDQFIPQFKTFANNWHDWANKKIEPEKTGQQKHSELINHSIDETLSLNTEGVEPIKIGALP